jgi:hypothetical protein
MNKDEFVYRAGMMDVTGKFPTDKIRSARKIRRRTSYRRGGTTVEEERLETTSLPLRKRGEIVNTMPGRTEELEGAFRVFWRSCSEGVI